MPKSWYDRMTEEYGTLAPQAQEEREPTAVPNIESQTPDWLRWMYADWRLNPPTREPRTGAPVPTFNPQDDDRLEAIRYYQSAGIQPANVDTRSVGWNPQLDQTAQAVIAAANQPRWNEQLDQWSRAIVASQMQPSGEAATPEGTTSQPPQGGGEFALETAETPRGWLPEKGALAQFGEAVDVNVPGVAGAKQVLGAIAGNVAEGIRQAQVFPRVIGAADLMSDPEWVAKQEGISVAEARRRIAAAQELNQLQTQGEFASTPEESQQIAERIRQLEPQALKAKPETVAKAFSEQALSRFEEKAPAPVQIATAFLDPSNILFEVPGKVIGLARNAERLATIQKAYAAAGMAQRAKQVEEIAKSMGLSSERAARFLKAEADFSVPIAATSDDVIRAAKVRESVYANVKDSGRQFFGLVQGKPFNPFRATREQILEKIRSLNPLEMTPAARASQTVDRAATVVNYLAARAKDPETFARYLTTMATDEGRRALAGEVGSVVLSKAGVETT
ncbi:MAG: hypothetical protein N2559_15825, partial [Anaerolineae bacterium]|nr:hypothetical protein [Anaerolineae bacterium]